MARMKFLCDAERCIECNACVTACKNEHEVPWGVNRRRVVTIQDGKPGERSISVACMHCSDAPCTAVCPVDCFYEGENMLVINPDECIDCGVCEPECPEDAILPDTDEEGAKWVEFNGKWSQQWAVLTEKKDPMPDHEKHSGEPGRLEKYFKDK